MPQPVWLQTGNRDPCRNRVNTHPMDGDRRQAKSAHNGVEENGRVGKGVANRNYFSQSWILKALDIGRRFCERRRAEQRFRAGLWYIESAGDVQVVPEPGGDSGVAWRAKCSPAPRLSTRRKSVARVRNKTATKAAGCARRWSCRLPFRTLRRCSDFCRRLPGSDD
jgi:hypothetical protein